MLITPLTHTGVCAIEFNFFNILLSPTDLYKILYFHLLVKNMCII